MLTEIVGGGEKAASGKDGGGQKMISSETFLGAGSTRLYWDISEGHLLH